MMPSLASKSKTSAIESNKLSGSDEKKKSIQVDEVAPPPAEDFSTQNQEAKNGILRLADYLKREKKSNTPVKKNEEKQNRISVKELKMKEYSIVPPQEIQMRNALNTYAWVSDYNSVVIGTCINKYF